MPDQPTWWKYVVDCAQIASSIGTCGAVIVSLWLANRKPKPELRLTVGLRILLGGGMPGPPWPEFLCINIVNLGNTPATVEGFSWKPSRRAKLAGYQNVDSPAQHAQNPRLPVTLQHGQSATFFVEAGRNGGWFKLVEEEGFFDEILSTRGRLNKLRLHAFTSVGVVAKTKPATDVLDRLWTAIQVHKVRTAS
ncbi:hypothetical protein [Burkholderia multivorans]|uniref:hypothetical protein n=1 Tax=Burkholderia multivorans TaxID=87883 RepID=UPI001C240DA7|nr:hypothetical protein [Burkholderia multivorans]MBU9224073.1 hypothetical protein [Burkholderia multivorans]MBU9419878.1 hypothetical protein [Burkholderia multivorans]MBU9479718.1 hypothetical protein [Burkholderia multivorans]